MVRTLLLKMIEYRTTKFEALNATLCNDCNVDFGFSIAIRADMDGLPIHETTGLEFASKNDGSFFLLDLKIKKFLSTLVLFVHFLLFSGVMHACGHDGHVSILLSVAEILYV